MCFCVSFKGNLKLKSLCLTFIWAQSHRTEWRYRVLLKAADWCAISVTVYNRGLQQGVRGGTAGGSRHFWLIRQFLYFLNFKMYFPTNFFPTNLNFLKYTLTWIPHIVANGYMEAEDPLIIYIVGGPCSISPSVWGSLAWKTLKTPGL